MAFNYDKYINRLKAKRRDNPLYGLADKTIQAFAEPTMAANRQMQGSLAMAGGSVGARAEMQNQFLQQNVRNQQAVMNSIPAQQNDGLDQQIMTLEMQRDRERDAKKDAGLKTALQIGGTALGAIGGALLLPGVGAVPGAAAGSAAAAGIGGVQAAMLGAQIGSGLGSAAGGLVGGVDEGRVIQGVGDMIEGISSTVALGDQKATLGMVQENWDLLKADPKAFDLMLAGIQSGNMDLVKSVMGGLNAVPEIDVLDETEDAEEMDVGAETEIETETASPAAQPFTPTIEPPAPPLANVDPTIYTQADPLKNPFTTESLSMEQRINRESISAPRKRPATQDELRSMPTEELTAVKEQAVAEANAPAPVDAAPLRKMSDDELKQQTIVRTAQAREGAGPGKRQSVPADVAPVEAAKAEPVTPTLDKFEAARTSMNASNTYTKIFKKMEEEGWAYDSKELSAWVGKQGYAKGTYGRFKKIYAKAMPKQAEVTPLKEQTDEELKKTVIEAAKAAGTDMERGPESDAAQQVAIDAPKPGLEAEVPVKKEQGSYEVYKGGATKGKPSGIFVSQNGVLMQKSGGTYVRVKHNGKDIPCKPGAKIIVNADGTIIIKEGK